MIMLRRQRIIAALNLGRKQGIKNGECNIPFRRALSSLSSSSSSSSSSLLFSISLNKTKKNNNNDLNYFSTNNHYYYFKRCYYHHHYHQQHQQIIGGHSRLMDNENEHCDNSNTTTQSNFFKKAVSNNIRSCLNPRNNDNENDDDGDDTDRNSTATSKQLLDEKSKDTGMSLCFLGTGAGQPTRERSTSATLLRSGGLSYLFDVGEGVQRQFSFILPSPKQVTKIFITHLHGDHIFGLPGLLIFLVQNRRRSTAMKQGADNDATSPAIQVYGPPGIYNFIVSNIVLSCAAIKEIDLEIFELTGGTVRRQTKRYSSNHDYCYNKNSNNSNNNNDNNAKRQHQKQQRHQLRNPFEYRYEEFSSPGIKRRSIPCQPDGTWVIEPFKEFTKEEVLSSKQLQEQGNTTSQYSIHAAEVQHVPGVPTFGFVLQEFKPQRNIDASRAKELGVSHKDRKFVLLKHGFSVPTDDNSRMVDPEEVLLPQKRIARKVAIIGDNCGWSDTMKQLAKQSDVLVHEATLFDEEMSVCVDRGHSTAAMAGKFAGEVEAKLLVLNHISSKAEHDLENVATTAHKASNGNCQHVVTSQDFMEILIPRMGFENESIMIKSKHEKEETRSSNSEQEKQGPMQSLLRQWFGI